MKKALGSIVLAGLLAFMPTTAFAEDNRALRSEGHVDSPKVAWDEAAQNLTIMAGPEPSVPIEQSVNWLHRAYSGKQPWYYFSVPEEEHFRFLGETGAAVYAGLPANAIGNQALWIGYAGDTALPVQNFKDENAYLEIVDFNGPGRMDLFSGGEWDFPLNRHLSSHDTAYRATPVTAGTHTHPTTTFTKPGRYQVTYRATARTKEGKFLQSKPQTVEWQVGGTNPKDSDAQSVHTRYQASDKYAGTDWDVIVEPTEGAEPLTRFTFNAPAEGGSVAYFIDGYFLAEVPVIDGTAVYEELIGEQAAVFQAVYLPAGNGSGFVTAPFTYQAGQQGSAPKEFGEFPQPNTVTPAPQYAPQQVHPDNPKVTMQATTSGDEMILTVQPADDRITAHVSGGWGDDLDDALASCPVEFISAPGARSTTIGADWVESCSSFTPHFTVTPSPYATVGATTLSVPSSDGTFTAEGEFAGGPESPQEDTPTPAPTPDSPQSPAAPEENTDVPNEDDTKQESPVEDSPVRISNGHVDIGVVANKAGGLTMVLGDDSRTTENQRVLRKPESVVLEANLRGRERSDKYFGGATYDFLGDNGTTLYLLPQQRTHGLVWPGFSTEQVAAEDFPEGVKLTVSPKEAPEGARWWAFTNNGPDLGKILAAAEKSYAIGPHLGMHEHVNWVFTHPGRYTLSVKASGVDKNGEQHTSKPAIFTFDITDRVSSPTPEEDAGTATPPAAPTEPTKPSDGSQQCHVGDIISRGHMDQAVALQDGAFVTFVKDSADPRKPIARKSGTFSYAVPDISQVKVDGNVPGFSSLAKDAPDGAWVLPETNDPRMPWVGFSTEKVDYRKLTAEGVTVELRDFSGPGRLVAGQYRLGEGFITMWDSANPKLQHRYATPAHDHPAMYFTAEGVYQMEFVFKAQLKTGKRLEAPLKTTFLVGSEAIGTPQCASSTEDKAASQTGTNSSPEQHKKKPELGQSERKASRRSEKLPIDELVKKLNAEVRGETYRPSTSSSDQPKKQAGAGVRPASMDELTAPADATVAQLDTGIPTLPLATSKPGQVGLPTATSNLVSSGTSVFETAGEDPDANAESEDEEVVLLEDFTSENEDQSVTALNSPTENTAPAGTASSAAEEAGTPFWHWIVLVSGVVSALGGGGWVVRQRFF